MMCTKTAFFALSLVVLINNLAFMIPYTGCPTTYQTRHFFNNFKTNEDIVMRFEQEYVPCVRNEEECVRRAPSCCDTEQRFTSQPACILPDAPLCLSLCHLAEGAYTIRLLFVSVVYSVSSHSWKMYQYTLEEQVFIVRTYWKTINNVMSTAIPGEVWRSTSAEQVLHLGLVEETGNQGDFIGRADRRLSENVRGNDPKCEGLTTGISQEVTAPTCTGIGVVQKHLSTCCKKSEASCIPYLCAP